MDYKYQSLIESVKAWAPESVADAVASTIRSLLSQREDMLADMHGLCHSCQHYRKDHAVGPCKNCVFDKAAETPTEDNWEWKGDV